MIMFYQLSIDSLQVKCVNELNNIGYFKICFALQSSFLVSKPLNIYLMRRLFKILF